MDPHNLSQYLQMCVSLNCDKVTYPSTLMLLPLIWKQWCNTGQMTYFIFGNQYCCLKDAMNNCGPTCRSLKQSSITIQPPMFIHYDKFCKGCVRSNISWCLVSYGRFECCDLPPTWIFLVKECVKRLQPALWRNMTLLAEVINFLSIDVLLCYLNAGVQCIS